MAITKRTAQRILQHMVHKTTKNKYAMCSGHHYAQINTNNVNKTCARLQTTGGHTNRTSPQCGNRNGLHNTEPRTQRHTTGQHKKQKRWTTSTPAKKLGVNSCAREVTSFQKNHAVINELIRPHNYYVIVADIISVSNECYSRNASCVLTWIYPCLFYMYIVRDWRLC
jgi:23S rRNA A1618 N6-methylase RlmF